MALAFPGTYSQVSKGSCANQNPGSYQYDEFKAVRTLKPPDRQARQETQEYTLAAFVSWRFRNPIGIR
jgi:hypothetical protein